VKFRATQASPLHTRATDSHLRFAMHSIVFASALSVGATPASPAPRNRGVTGSHNSWHDTFVCGGALAVVRKAEPKGKDMVLSLPDLARGAVIFP